MFLELIVLGIFMKYNGGLKIYENHREFQAEKQRMKEIEIQYKKLCADDPKPEPKQAKTDKIVDF